MSSPTLATLRPELHLQLPLQVQALASMLVLAVAVVLVTFGVTRALANRNSVLAAGRTVDSHHLRTSSVVALVLSDGPIDASVATLRALVRQSRRPGLILVRSTDTSAAHAALAAQMRGEFGNDHHIQLLSDTRPVGAARAMNQLWHCVPRDTGHVMVVPAGTAPAPDAIEQALREFDRAPGLGAVDALTRLPHPVTSSWWSRVVWRLQRLELGLVSPLAVQRAPHAAREAHGCTVFSYEAMADLAFTRSAGPFAEATDPASAGGTGQLRLTADLEALGHGGIRSARVRVDVPAAATLRQWWRQRLAWQRDSTTELMRHGLTPRTRPLAISQARLAIALTRRLVTVLLAAALVRAVQLQHWSAGELAPYALVGIVMVGCIGYRLRRQPSLSTGDRITGLLVLPVLATNLIEGTALVAGTLWALTHRKARA